MRLAISSFFFFVYCVLCIYFAFVSAFIVFLLGDGGPAKIVVCYLVARYLLFNATQKYFDWINL